jgi:hypothetical protein
MELVKKAVAVEHPFIVVAVNLAVNEHPASSDVWPCIGCEDPKLNNILVTR